MSRRALAREQLAVRANEVLRGERLFGRDPFEAEIVAQRSQFSDFSRQ